MIIPALALLVLGRGFDFFTGQPTGTQFYDKDDIEKEIIHIKKHFVKSQYRFVESAQDVNDFLNIDGEISIKAKGGAIGISGMGQYLMDKVDREKTVEMLIQVYHETETKTFPSYIPLRHKTTNNTYGTHYVRSITYGGRLIISYRLHANRTEDMEKIKGSVKGNLQLSGSIDSNLTGTLSKLKNEISGYSSTEIKAYFTTPPIPVKSVEDIYKAVKRYPDEVKKVNGGLGNALLAEIVPVRTLNSDYADFVRSSSLMGVLASAQDKLNDLRIFSEDCVKWYTKKAFQRDVTMSDEQINRFEDLRNKVNQAEGKLRKAINNLDSTKGPEQFDEAFKLYGEGGDNQPNKYSRLCQKIQHEYDEIPFHWYPYTKAITDYIRWGNITCSLPSTKPLFVGYAALSKGQLGGGKEPLCLPATKPALDTVSKELDFKSTINGLNYTFGKESRQIFCAHCVLQNASAIFVVPGRIDCPSESKLEYNGYLMLSKNDRHTSPICLDKNPVPVEDFPETQPNADTTTSILGPALMECNECEDEKDRPMPCAVCSR